MFEDLNSNFRRSEDITRAVLETKKLAHLERLKEQHRAKEREHEKEMMRLKHHQEHTIQDKDQNFKRIMAFLENEIEKNLFTYKEIFLIARRLAGLDTQPPNTEEKEMMSRFFQYTESHPDKFDF